MKRISFIEHNNRQILFVNFAGVEMEDMTAVIDEAKEVIAAQPAKSVFCLTDVTGAGFSKEVIKHLKAYVAHNKPYIWRSAVVGVEGIIGVIFQGVVKFSGRGDLVLKESLEEAQAWLSEQPLPG